MIPRIMLTKIDADGSLDESKLFLESFIAKCSIKNAMKTQLQR